MKILALNEDNKHLMRAYLAKNDEFYTRYEDIEKELIHYEKELKDKIIYCKADTPPAIFENTFTNPYISFGVPATSIQQYRAADFWEEYQIYGFNF